MLKRAPREVVVSPALELFETCLGRALSNSTGPASMEQESGLQTPRGHSQPKLSHGSWKLVNNWIVSSVLDLRDSGQVA